MPIDFVQVDAFTAIPFAGNPAAICVLPSAPPDHWMQSLALENNLSETAFVVPQADGFSLRWFTPDAEVELCGHATLAAAHVLWADGHVPADQPCRFHTCSGLLVAHREANRIGVDFSRESVESIDAPQEVVNALGVSAVATALSKRLGYFIAEVSDEKAVLACKPELMLLRGMPYKGYIVTAPGNSGVDFVSRFFAPALGVDEDPVTGSAHCVLGTYWSEKLGKTAMQAVQVSARRGEIGVEMRGDTVRLYGQTVTVLRATLDAAAEF